ncbi:EGF-like domain-containing protein 2 [Saccostrea echinata]|uniref:EGF-like domain-containing protein 2 n=1 Tax=Saccostrea echinata TaxID=191078 RepID=UPI002A82ADF4|nr:EGF-like domain-containing protein 2 [Saccostrea echinata]
MNLKEILFVGFILFVNIVFAKWHCRNRLTGGCLNGGTCDSDSGVCTCPPGFEGYNCGLETALICPDDNAADCRNGGTCYNTDQCFCTADYIGAQCETPISSMECRGEGTDITVIVPNGFRGEIYSQRDGSNDDVVPEECKFTATAARPDNYIPYTFTIPFDRTSPCINATLNETVNENGDSVFSSVIVKTYSTMFITDYDEQLTFVCIHSTSNYTLGTRLDQVDLDKSRNLQTDKKDGDYSPVRMNVLNEDDTNLTGQVNVGDVIKLRFYLDDETVYKNLRMEDCTANDTRLENGNSFQFLERGCPTEAGAAIMVNTDGQTLTRITHPVRGEGEVAAAILPIYAFKFKSTGNVAFNCQLKICRDGEDCNPNCGAPAADDAAPAATDVAPVAPTNGPADAVPTDVAPTDVPGVAPADGGAPVDVATDVPLDAVPTDPPAPARRRRRAASGEEGKIFSAKISVVDPFESQWRANQVTSVPPPTTESPAEEKTCFRSQEILIVIIVMSAFVFVLLVACLVMSCTILKLRHKFNCRENESESHMPRFFLPHAKLQA